MNRLPPTSRDPAAVDLDIAAVEEDVDRAGAVLLAESQSVEAGHADLGAEERKPRQQGSVPSVPQNLSAASAIAFT